MGKKRLNLFVGLVLSAFSSAMIVINPMLSQHLIDDVILPQNTEPLLRILGIMLIVQVLRLSLRYLMIVILELNSTDVMTNIRQRMYDIIQNQDYKFLDQFRTGNLMTRMTSDLEMTRHSLAWISYQMVDSISLFGSAFIFLLFINWKLALCLAVTTPVILFISNRFIRHFRPRTMLLRKKLTELSAKVMENIGGNRVVKAFAREEYEKEQFERHNADYRDTSYGNALISAKYQPLLDLLSQLLPVITLAVGGVFLIDGSMTPGQYMAFSSLTWALSNPLRMLGMLLADLQRFHAAAVMIIEVFESKSRIVDKPDAIKLIRPSGRIEFKQVYFSIDGNPILEDISFKAEPGQTIGVLGSTGAGKTSLINMLLRFYEPTSGVVSLDGVSVDKYTLSSLRRRVGLAMQDVFLFSDSVEGNISYGRPELDHDSIRMRAVQADADSFVNKMEDGYNTLVGERGVGLSGGQKQRISLARALAVKPAVLILDDTTSAVDSETERYIQEQLRNLDFPCTKIVIAQRISSFRGADLILVMDKGRIVERGTHEELLANKGFYHYIWTLQYGVSDTHGMLDMSPQEDI
ncbi:MAG: ABC transporter ATP-binding protein/permease [Treponema sp.]|jgi:ATP-binding cassette subfamily B protein|nr:ABC transporter ATP-binding protein/permease [Treponema sp.]